MTLGKIAVMWYEQNPDRLQREIDSMNGEFPEFELYCDENSQSIGWIGSLKIKDKIFRITIEYPSFYPNVQPKIHVFIEKPFAVIVTPTGSILEYIRCS